MRLNDLLFSDDIIMIVNIYFNKSNINNNINKMTTAYYP